MRTTAASSFSFLLLPPSASRQPELKPSRLGWDLFSLLHFWVISCTFTKFQNCGHFFLSSVLWLWKSSQNSRRPGQKKAYGGLLVVILPASCQFLCNYKAQKQGKDLKDFLKLIKSILSSFGYLSEGCTMHHAWQQTLAWSHNASMV